ncbi:MAG: hypothetical protein LAO06_07360 [Acidobacteriia bacterium]|nr:hypothetical protein [Terriglobia bacterium]
MTVWLGQLVISKATHNGGYWVQYWRKPSMSPASLEMGSAEDLRRYLRHCRLSESTPEQLIEQLRSTSRVSVSTIEFEEKIG